MPFRRLNFFLASSPISELCCLQVHKNDPSPVQESLGSEGRPFDNFGDALAADHGVPVCTNLFFAASLRIEFPRSISVGKPCVRRACDHIRLEWCFPISESCHVRPLLKLESVHFVSLSDYLGIGEVFAFPIAASFVVDSFGYRRPDSRPNVIRPGHSLIYCHSSTCVLRVRVRSEQRVSQIQSKTQILVDLRRRSNNLRCFLWRRKNSIACFEHQCFSVL